jgi:cell division protein FtsI (penicillin-binding protein 3)
MQNSSNVGTIKLGLRVGEERLKSYIDKYGFGQKTLIDLPAEVGGTVHDLSDWGKTSIASISMGHEVTVTPLQTAVMVSTVANGGTRYKPYVVQKIDDPRGGVTEIKPSGTRVMSQTTAGQLRVMLEDVVTDGTAKTSQLEGYRAAGKTGTAEKVDNVNGGYFSSKYVSSFAGFVPVSNPRLTIVVVIDEPKGQPRRSSKELPSNCCARCPYSRMFPITLRAIRWLQKGRRRSSIIPLPPRKSRMSQ